MFYSAFVRFISINKHVNMLILLNTSEKPYFLFYGFTSNNCLVYSSFPSIEDYPSGIAITEAYMLSTYPHWQLFLPISLSRPTKISSIGIVVSLAHAGHIALTALTCIYFKSSSHSIHTSSFFCSAALKIL